MRENIYIKTLTGAGMWSKVIGRNKVLRIRDVSGGSNVGMLLYNALERHERYNMPDTLKGQQVFFLRDTVCLHSDMGRVLASVTADTCGWHDTVCGISNADSVTHKYGENTYQDTNNEFHRNAYECFMIELAKWGMGEKDLIPNVNWFSKVVSNDEGELEFVEGNSKPGAYIDLRLDMDTLVVLNLCHHPLNPSSEYSSSEVLLEVRNGDPVSVDDLCRCSHPENVRAFENTEDYHTLRF